MIAIRDGVYALNNLANAAKDAVAGRPSLAQRPALQRWYAGILGDPTGLTDEEACKVMRGARAGNTGDVCGTASSDGFTASLTVPRLPVFMRGDHASEVGDVFRCPRLCALAQVQ